MLLLHIVGTAPAETTKVLTQIRKAFSRFKAKHEKLLKLQKLPAEQQLKTAV